MPVLRIRALPQRPGIDVAAAMKNACCYLARVLRIPEEQVWATWETIPPGLYVEGTQAVGVQPAATHPPLVELVAFEGRSPETIERMLVTVAQVLATSLGLEPGNVYVTYEETRAGRVYTGGAVRRG